MAGILTRAFPRWLAWTALVIAIAQLTPVGFLAPLVFLLWTLIASIDTATSPTDAVPETTQWPFVSARHPVDSMRVAVHSPSFAHSPAPPVDSWGRGTTSVAPG